jgi:hypothetical protein
MDACDDAVERLVLHRAAEECKYAREWATLGDGL